MKKGLARLIKAIIALGVFLGLFLGLQWTALGALLLGGTTYLGSGLFIRSPRTKHVLISGSGYVPIPEKAGGNPGTGKDVKRLDSPQTSSIVADGREMLKQIRLASLRIANGAFREGVARICDTGEEIMRQFEQKPHDVLAGRKFVDYYLATTLKIVTLYRDLSNRPGHSEQERAILAKAEESLPALEAGFQRQIGRLQEDNFMDLDTELAVLESTMKFEGF